MTNKTLIFKKVPTGLPVPGEHLTIEDQPFDQAAPPPKGGITAQILWASFDPYLRGKMRPATTKSYSPPFDLGGPVSNDTIARVLKSDSPDFAPGDTVVAYLPIAQFARVDGGPQLAARVRKLHNPLGLDLAYFLGPLGMPGLTAYSALHRIGAPRKGETIFISSAAGAVGQVVGQVAAREGLRVIGSVGSDDKLEFITKELGFDGGFNYKKEKPGEALARLAPDGVDIYFENVGGEQLDAVLEVMNTHGRIIACGMVSFSFFSRTPWAGEGEGKGREETLELTVSVGRSLVITSSPTRGTG